MNDALARDVGLLAAEAGQLAMEKWRGDFGQWEKSPGNPVSDVDLAVDAMLRAELRRLDPDAGWFSEETADSPERLLGSRVWVVDPIDGTRDFVKGKRGWAVSIALVEGGRVVLGVLDAPARGEHWRATLGEGAWRNNQPISASSAISMKGARVPAEALPRTETELVPVAKPNSIALRIAMVGADEADLVATLRWGFEWDIAAAALIAQEAGAVVTDAHGGHLRFNTTKGEAFGVLATSPGIHAAAVARLTERAKVAAKR